MKDCANHRRPIWMIAASLFVVSVLLSTARETQAQWQGTGNIYYNGGNVGVGTTSPAQKLEVAGNVSLGGAGTGNYFYAYYNSSTNYAGMTATSGWELTTFHRIVIASGEDDYRYLRQRGHRHDKPASFVSH